jgi:hypothetical protein
MVMNEAEFFKWWHPYIARIQDATIESNQRKVDRLMEGAIAEARKKAFEECQEMAGEIIVKEKQLKAAGAIYAWLDEKIKEI